MVGAGQEEAALLRPAAERAALRPASLWEHWEGPEGEAIGSCALLTTTPNDLIRAFHHRMPVILDHEAYALWLDPALQGPDRVQPLLRQYPPEAMTIYPVSARVNNPANDTPDCVTPLNASPRPLK